MDFSGLNNSLDTTVLQFLMNPGESGSVDQSVSGLENIMLKVSACYENAQIRTVLGCLATYATCVSRAFIWNTVKITGNVRNSASLVADWGFSFFDQLSPPRPSLLINPIDPVPIPRMMNIKPIKKKWE